MGGWSKRPTTAEVTFEITEKEIPGEHADTDFFNEKGKSIKNKPTGDVAYDNENNTIHVKISMHRNGDAMDQYSDEMMLNVVGTHEIKGHISNTGGKVDHHHDDLMNDPTSIYKSSSYYQHSKAVLEYVVMNKMPMELAICGSCMADYKGKTWAENIASYKSEMAKIITAVSPDKETADKKIEEFNAAADKKFEEAKLK